MPSLKQIRCLSLPVAAGVLVLCAFPTISAAGEYRVYSCKTPSGMPAPTDGWAATRGESVYSQPLNYCGSGGPLIAELNPAHAQPANTGLVTWGWTAAPGSTIAAYRVWRSAQLRHNGEPGVTAWVFSTREINAATEGYIVDNCPASYGCSGLGVPTPGISQPNLLSEDLRTKTTVDRWFINAACGGTVGQSCMPNGVLMAMARVHAAEFTLRDPDGPTVGAPTGRLVAAATHSGTELISFTAADSVSGVYRAILEVNGRVVRTSVVDDNDGRCADAGVDPNSPYEFLYREPCRKNVQHEMALDTRTLADGTHTVRVLVEDASGNRTAVWSSPEFVVRNAPGGVGGGVAGSGAGSGSTASTGTGAAARACAGASSGLTARFTRSGASRLTVRHGQAFSVRGRGPAGTDIDVLHIRGSKIKPLGSFRTSPTGSYTERFRARHGGGTIQLCGPGMTTKLTLRVKARVSLKVRISSWGLVRYSGRVSTGQIPRGGKIVAIQGKAGPSWQTFALRRTDRKGRFKGRYRLRVVRPGARLRFRVRVPSEAGYPFVGVVSKSVSKRVR